MARRNRRIWALILAPLMLAALTAYGGQVRIVDFGGGQVVWTNDFVVEGAYHVLGTPSLLAPGWQTNASGSQPPGAVVTQAVAVTQTQRFFRVEAVESLGASNFQAGGAVDFPTNWRGGAYPWFVTNAPLRPGGDGDVLRSGAISHGRYTWFGASFAGPIDLSFWWKASCQTDAATDFVAFYVDGAERSRLFGEADWTEAVHGVGPGPHRAIWKYAKNGSVVGGQDAAWVNAVATTPRSVVILEGEGLLYETDEDVPVQIDVHAYVESGESEWLVSVEPQYGSAFASEVTVTNLSLTYQPGANWYGTDAFEVAVGSGAETDRVAVTVIVDPVNDVPAIAEGASLHVVMDEDGSPAAFGLTLHAFDPDTPATNLLWTLTPPGATRGTAGPSNAVGSSLAVAYSPPGGWNSYTGFYAAPLGVATFSNATNVTFRFRVVERDSGLGDTINVGVEVRPRNDPPTNTVPPSIAGTARVAKVLTTIPGRYLNSFDLHATPTQYIARAYQWQRSSSGVGGWTNITGATGQSYRAQGDDYNMRVRVVETASDKGEGLPASQSISVAAAAAGPVAFPDPGNLPAGMAFIAAGPVTLGGLGGDARARTNYVSAFLIDKLEVTKALWDQVRAWGATNGYTDLAAGQAGTRYNRTNGTEEAAEATHPVVYVDWFDCVKWCNARSEMNRLTPVYYSGFGFTTPIRTGTGNWKSENVNWTGANGYRLPTEAEWEKAARGGLVGNLYPWGNTIGGSNANYRDSGDAFETNAGAVQGTTPAGYYDGGQTPAGPDMANGYALYDVAGNVMEWCWDRYTNSLAAYATDPRGPDTGNERVLRGGSWYVSSPPYTSPLRCADRGVRTSPGVDAMTYGFRPVRRL